MEKLLTVVIPAYNAEKYITYTLDSLCAGCKDQDLKKKNQSWTGNETESNIQTVSARMPDFQPGMDWSEYMEILIIDDGSRDQTGAIADQYAERYPTVSVSFIKKMAVMDLGSTAASRMHWGDI